jgi:hypothetical protein
MIIIITLMASCSAAAAAADVVNQICSLYLKNKKINYWTFRYKSIGGVLVIF